MARGFTRGRLPAKKIHTLRWAGLQANFLALSAGSSAVNILAAGAPAETILRMRGSFSGVLDGTQRTPHSMPRSSLAGQPISAYGSSSPAICRE